ncbi:MAG: nucleoside-diphosphate kinase [Chloroflexota bacterium]
MERSLILVKPDGVQRGLTSEVLGRFERRGLKIVGLKVLKPDMALAEEHYAEHKDKPFYNDLIGHITSGPVVAAVIQGPDPQDSDDPASGGIGMIRQTVGDTRPWQASPGSIRADLAMAVDRNVVHASANLEDAQREVALWFKPEELVDYSLDTDPWVLG